MKKLNSMLTMTSMKIKMILLRLHNRALTKEKGGNQFSITLLNHNSFLWTLSEYHLDMYHTIRP